MTGGTSLHIKDIIASNKEKYYNWVSKSLQEVEDYDECLAVSKEALEKLNNFTNNGDIWDGTFNGVVTNNKTIHQGIYNDTLTNNEGGVIQLHGTAITIGEGFQYVNAGGTVTGDHAFGDQHKCWCGELESFTITYDLADGALAEWQDKADVVRGH